MGHGKETPRQKMIGMMYLVLTAMLALNVSKEVLDAFINVNEGLNITTANFTSKVEGLYGRMDHTYAQNEEKARQWKEAADEVKQRSDELYEFINECKVEIVSVKDADAIHDGEVDLHEVAGKDNTDIPAQVMIVGKKGTELKERIDDYREYMISLIDNSEGNYDALVESIEGNLDTHDHPAEKAGEPAHSWESYNFEHLPLAAVITILSKMQADVRNVESDVVNYLLGQVGAKDFKVNKFRAVVLPNSNYVFKGQEYKAEVFLAAYDSTKAPTITVGGQELTVENGKGIYTATSSAVGDRSWGGVLILDNDGEKITREFEATYTVAETNAVISPTKMNVFYRGVENPVSISASGVTEDAIVARISAGNISPVSPGNYVVKPGPREDQSTVRVFARVDGKESFMGEMPFRVKNLPDPTAMVEGLPKGSGVLSLGQLTRLNQVEARADDFLFEVQYEVTGFQVNVMGSGGVNLIEESDSNTFTSAQRQIFQRMRPGQRVVIENIEAIGPDGVKRSLNSINIKIQ